MSDDYTPTTPLIRRAYITGMRQAFIASAGEHGDEFDRWLSDELAAARRAGREEQREVDAAIATVGAKLNGRSTWRGKIIPHWVGASIAAAIRAAAIGQN